MGTRYRVARADVQPRLIGQEVLIEVEAPESDDMMVLEFTERDARELLTELAAVLGKDTE